MNVSLVEVKVFEYKKRNGVRDTLSDLLTTRASITATESGARGQKCKTCTKAIYHVVMENTAGLEKAAVTCTAAGH